MGYENKACPVVQSLQASSPFWVVVSGIWHYVNALLWPYNKHKLYAINRGV